VCEEVGRLVGTDAVTIGRFETDEPALIVVAFGKGVQGVPAGSRWEHDDAMASTRAFRTGRSARVDQWEPTSAPEPAAATVRRLGLVSTVASPIVVEGHLWGALTASSKDESLPLDAAERLEKFCEVVATAIASVESREALGRLADEQAALRRVATLVAQGVRPEEIFAAVSEEVDHLFGLDEATVGRFEPDGSAFVVVGVAKSVEGVSIGSRWELDPLYASMEVFRTGHSARVEASDLESVGGPVAAELRRLGLISTVASPIIVEGNLWGAITVVSNAESLPLDTEERLQKFAELAATAIANAEGRSQLAASRARIIAASDEARRRIERDIHDGTQQRLVALGLAVRAAEAGVPSDSEVRPQLSRIATGLGDAVDELQEMSRGIHPANLARGGLRTALRGLARRSPIPVEVDATSDTRLPEPIEVAVYYVASEALANAAKHAHATRIEVSLTPRNGNLLLSIRDDGVGGADPARGSGLTGLTDRVEALGGRIQVRSPSGDGTEITAELPVELKASGDAD
jgi:signal transduction histidine kinase